MQMFRSAFVVLFMFAIAVVLGVSIETNTAQAYPADAPQIGNFTGFQSDFANSYKGCLWAGTDSHRSAEAVFDAYWTGTKTAYVWVNLVHEDNTMTPVWQLGGDVKVTVTIDGKWGGDKFATLPAASELTPIFVAINMSRVHADDRLRLYTAWVGGSEASLLAEWTPADKAESCI